ncbi:TPA: hypothetical protein TXJ16_000893 [Streptococcus suis]|nr:hypothetical protein [Streptococcus suis]
MGYFLLALVSFLAYLASEGHWYDYRRKVRSGELRDRGDLFYTQASRFTPSAPISLLEIYRQLPEEECRRWGISCQLKEQELIFQLHPLLGYHRMDFKIEARMVQSPLSGCLLYYISHWQERHPELALEQCNRLLTMLEEALFLLDSRLEIH